MKEMPVSKEQRVTNYTFQRCLTGRGTANATRWRDGVSGNTTGTQQLRRTALTQNADGNVSMYTDA